MKHEILVADDHAIIRNGLTKLLADTDHLQVAGEAKNGHELLEALRSRRWDAVVMDLSMPGRSGLDLVKQVKNQYPKLPLLVFSMHPEEHYAIRAIRLGASGYLSKDGEIDMIIPALEKIISGGRYISPAAAELLAFDLNGHSRPQGHESLSDREFEVLVCLATGLNPSDIAEKLSLSIKTVSTHKSHIMEKMGFSSNVELLKYALDHGLTDQAGC